MSDARHPELVISFAQESQIPLILSFIRKLADYEKLSSAVVADEAILRKSLFGSSPAGEVLLAYSGGIPAGIAIFFHNFSTFSGMQRHLPGRPVRRAAVSRQRHRQSSSRTRGADSS